MYSENNVAKTGNTSGITNNSKRNTEINNPTISAPHRYPLPALQIRFLNLDDSKMK